MSKWVNVADALQRGAAQLRLGEMLHTPTFQLAQAISAVEIGDPRMDFPLNESTHVPSLLADGKMPLGLDLPVQLAVVDSLIALLAQWWTGVTLLQTVYTSLYMLAQQDLVKDPYLKAATSIVTAIVGISKFIIYQSMVVEVRSLVCAPPELVALDQRRTAGRQLACALVPCCLQWCL